MSNHHRSIIWLSSYPKSGNTWVRFLLLNLVFGPQDSTEKLDTLIPDIHKCTEQPTPPETGHILVKTHHLLSASMPLVNYTAGFIYIVRNPMDVMISNLNYAYTLHGVESSQAVRDKIRQRYIEEYINNLGDTSWSRLGRGSWDEHIRSWLTGSHGLPNLVLKYEDLLDDPGGQLARVCNFLNMDKTQSELQAAVDNSSFDRMKSIEEKELAGKLPGFFLDENSEKSIREGNRFMFCGKTGTGIEALAKDQRERFLEKFGPAMELAGYQVQ